MRFGSLLAAMVLVYGCKGGDPDPIVDLDGDGFAEAEDCDDSDPGVFPAAVEVCDGIDQNCDGEIDEGLLTAYFRDGDSDGFGDPNDAVDECSRPAGYVEETGDCDDTRTDVFPGNSELCDPIDHDCDGSNTEGAPGNTTFYQDADNDGYGDRLVTERACDAPAGYVANPSLGDTTVINENFDCDDSDGAVNPGSDEYCVTAYDDNCDGLVNVPPEGGAVADGVDFPVDADGDGFGHETVTYTACVVGTAVDTTVPPDGIPEFVTVDVGLNTDCDDGNSSINPNAPEVCNGVDDDCDPATDENLVAIDTLTWFIDSDGDGSGLDTTTALSCTQPSGFAPSDVGLDCNDNDALVSPTGVELCGDGIDNNCDTLIDDPSAADAVQYWTDIDGDGFGDLNNASIFRCSQPSGFADNPFDCDDLENTIGAPPPQYLDSDADGYGDPLVEQISCTALSGYVDNDLDCDDTNLIINPDTPWYLDGDGDGFGLDGSILNQCLQPSGYSGASGDCDDGEPTTNPDAFDMCDGIDNNCNGDVDEDCTIEHCGTIDADETWATGFIHLVTCDVRVQGSAGPILTIEDGADVRFRDGTQLRIGATVAQPGTLQAYGSTLGVRFRSEFPLTPGAWDGIEIGPGADVAAVSVIEGALIEHANGTAIRVDSVEVALDDVTIDGANGAAITLDRTAVLGMVNSSLINNAGPGVTSSAAARLGTFQNNIITGNAAEPLIISAASIGEIDNANTYGGNGVPFIGLLTGDVDTDQNLALLDADYRVDGTVAVRGGSAPVLTIDDGVLVEFSAGTDLTVGDGDRGGIQINGTGAGVEFRGTQATEGYWDGMYLASGTEVATVTGLTIAHGGGNGFGNIRMQGNTGVPADERLLVTLDSVDSSLSSQSGIDARDVKLDMINSRLFDNQEHGAEILGVTFSQSDLSGNEFSTNADSGVRISPELVELLTGNTYTGNGLPIEVTGGVVPDNASWVQLSEDYYITGRIDVEDVDAPVLSLEAGVSLYFETSGQLRAGVSDQGSLISNGAVGNPVRWLPITEYLGNPSTRGAYRGLELGAFQRQSLLSYTEILYSGQDNTQGALSVTGTHPNPVELDAVLIQYSGSHGLVAGNGAELFVHDSSFLDNDDYGVLFTSDNTIMERGTGNYGFEFNTIEGNGLEPLVVFATDVGRVSLSNFLSDVNSLVSANPSRVVVAGGQMLRDSTWPDHGLPYWLLADMDVGGPAAPLWQIDPGVTIEVEPGLEVGIRVGRGDFPSGMLAIGTPADPIVFTSAAAFPARGDWAMLELGEECDAENDNCRLDNVVIEYGGARADEASLSVVFRQVSLGETKPVVVQNTLVRESGANGIMFAFYNGIVTPTPDPGIIVPVMCEDLDYDYVCDAANYVNPSDSVDWPDGYDFCYAGGFHGQSNTFCASNNSNVFARNFSNPYMPRRCEDVGLSDGPQTCP